jgi:hypothetical protein
MRHLSLDFLTAFPYVMGHCRSEEEQKPDMLTARDEEILKAVAYYRYITLRDIVALRFSPDALTHARKVLSALCGSEDLQTHHYLCRFTCLLRTARGNGSMY